MNGTNDAKCGECGSREMRVDDGLGEVVCRDCGLVAQENMIDELHESGRFGEGAHNTPLGNDSRSSKRGMKRTTTDWGQKKNGCEKNRKLLRQLGRVEKFTGQDSRRMRDEIREKIMTITGSRDVATAAEPYLKYCFDKELEGDGYGPLPLNQTRFMKKSGDDECEATPPEGVGENDGDENSKRIEKDSAYVITACAIAIIRVLAARNNIPYRFWKEDAVRLGIEPSDINKLTKMIKVRMKTLFWAKKCPIDPKDGLFDGRQNALYAYEMRLVESLRNDDIEKRQAFIKWMRERIDTLDNSGEGPMGTENPDTLLAMVTIVGIDKFGIRGVSKKSVATEIFLLSVGAVNARLNHQVSPGRTLRELIERWSPDDRSVGEKS